jgi:hypothetical protein
MPFNHSANLEPEMVPPKERPTYRITLRPGPNVDGVRTLRRALKTLGRRFGLTAISVEEVRHDTERGE